MQPAPKPNEPFDVPTEKGDGLNRYTARLVNWRGDWIEKARPNQLPPLVAKGGNPWRIWSVIAGRGFGKTRIGAEHSAFMAAITPKGRYAVIGPTQHDTRSVCFEGESGLEAVIPPYFVKRYSSTDLELELINNALLVGKSAEKPDRLRGPQWHGGWGDEVASWGASNAANAGGDQHRLQETWDNYIFGLRLGTNPRTVLTTTPRPIPFIRGLVTNPHCVVTTGSTFDNAKNLAASALETFKAVYEGTRKGEQELHGVILQDVEGALWKSAQLDLLRVDNPPELIRVVVAVDPAVTSENQSDETGIIVAGLGTDGHVYVLADLSGKYTPSQWAGMVLTAYERFKADCALGETNQGGDLVESNLKSHAEGRAFAFKKVHAKRGKYLRAEPVSGYYEKGKVHHVGAFPKLEKQMCEFTGSTGGNSPDRLDANVYAVGELILGNVRHAFW